MKKKKLLVCDVEGTLFKADFKIPGTDYASTMWQPLAQKLDEFNRKKGIVETPSTVDEEKESHAEWKKGQDGKYCGFYLNWVDDTVYIHQKHGMCREVFDEVLNGAKYNDGVVEFFRQLDTMDDEIEYIPVLISGGFVELIEKAQTELLDKNGLSVIRHGFGACKYIWDKDGKMKAYTLQPSDFEHKYSFLKIVMQQYGLNETSDWIFVGDGENDSDIASRAPVSFAINPHVKLAAVATYTIDSFMDIPELLKTDEVSRYISTKRGLSNTQAITVGQRMKNAGELSGLSCKEYEADGGTLKYRLDVTLGGSEDIFDAAIRAIIDWAKLYAENDERYDEVFELKPTDSFYNFFYDGTATISCSYIESGGEKKWGFNINAPDLGTHFRQPVFGARVCFDILLVKPFDKNEAELKLRVSVTLPQKCYAKTHNISTEVYCPKFIRGLAADGIVIKTADGLRITPNYETLGKSEKIKGSAYIPTVFVEKSKKEYLALLPQYLFGFAKVYSVTRNQVDEFYNGAEVVVLFPDEYGEEPKIYNEQAFIDPSDNIGYDVNENHHIVYSPSNGTGQQALLVNITDYTVGVFKRGAEKLALDKQNFYETILRDVTLSENEKRFTEYRKSSAVSIVNASKSAIKSADIDAIRKAEKRAKEIIEGEKQNLYLSAAKYEQLLLQFTGAVLLLEKGELLLAAIKDVETGGASQYPVGILQPVINAVEICANIYALLADKKFLKFKTEEFRELGTVIRYIYENGLADESDPLVNALKAANGVRHESAHPNRTASFDNIINKKRDTIYEAINALTAEMKKIL